VAIVAGGARRPGRDIARGLAIWGWPIVVVYLDDQARAEAAVVELIEVGGTALAVRADLHDDLDVQRLFTESIAAFGVVDVVVDATTEAAELLHQHAAHFLREWGAVVSTTEAAPMSAWLASDLHERGLVVGRVPPGAVLAFLERWRQRNHT
jgi:3-oxoacyl-[acyl-carrier protein] reductase